MWNSNYWFLGNKLIAWLVKLYFLGFKLCIFYWSKILLTCFSARKAIWKATATTLPNTLLAVSRWLLFWVEIFKMWKVEKTINFYFLSVKKMKFSHNILITYYYYYCHDDEHFDDAKSWFFYSQVNIFLCTPWLKVNISRCMPWQRLNPGSRRFNNRKPKQSH